MLKLLDVKHSTINKSINLFLRKQYFHIRIKISSIIKIHNLINLQFFYMGVKNFDIRGSNTQLGV